MKQLVRLSIVLLAISSNLLAADRRPPMVISVSWSSPDPRYLKQHIGEWEQRPFTGTAINISGPSAPETGSVELAAVKDNLSWTVFERGKRFSPQMLIGPAEDLSQTKFTRCRDNFLWVVSYYSHTKEGAYFDWFDDARWADILHNIEGLARLAKEGGLTGLAWDCEEYGSPLWSYGAEAKRPGFALKNLEPYRGKSWKQVSAQVRQRGHSFIKAINKGYPGCLMWLLVGYSGGMGPAYSDHPPPDYWAEQQGGLAKAFLDGMLEASDDQTIFVDGCEGTYGYSEPEQFWRMRKIVTEKALHYTNVPEIYRKKIRVGFGIYLDLWRHKAPHPWYSDRPQSNYMTPARLEKALRNALEISDGYVWIYSEIPSWWLMGPEARFGANVRSRDDHAWIHPAYERAVERAMASAAHRRPTPPTGDLFAIDNVTATKEERAIASAANIAPVSIPAGMFDTLEAGNINDGSTATKADMHLQRWNPLTSANGMGYDFAGHAKVEKITISQTGSSVRRDRLKSVKVYFLGGSQTFTWLPTPDDVTLTLAGGGVNSTYVMVKGLATQSGALAVSKTLHIAEIEVQSTDGRTAVISPVYEAGVSISLQGAGWSNRPAVLNDGNLAALRQSATNQLIGSGMLSGETITYDLGKPVAGLERIGIAQSGVSSSGDQTSMNDFIRTLTLKFATDPQFTNIVSTQEVTLIDELPYQQATFDPVTAQHVRVGASSLFAKGGTYAVALAELQFYTFAPRRR